MTGTPQLLPAGRHETASFQVPETDLTAARLGLIGGMLLVACVTVFALAGQSKSNGYLVYLFLVGIAPLLAALLLFAAGDRHSLGTKLALASRLFLVFVLIGALMLGAVEYIDRSELASIGPFLAVIFGSVLVTAMICWPRRHPRRLPPLSDPVRRIAVLKVLDALLIGLVVAFTVFYGRFYPAGHPGVPLASDLVIYAWETPHFAAWVGLGLTITCAAIGLWRVQDRISIRTKRLLDRLALVVAGLFVLSLFDEGLYVNLPHYMVHVGPAMHAFHGGIAMVDVYSVYGLLPWVVVKTAFDVLAPTFGTAALVVRLSELVTLLTMVFVLYAVSRRRLAALGLMVPAVLVAITFHPWLYNLGALPSTSGLRYLVPALMVLVLVAVRSTIWSRWLGVGLLMLASLWSLETFVYTLAPWGYVLLLQAVRERSLRRAGLTLLIGGIGVVLAHATFTLGTFLATGKTIDYGPYFGQFLRFRPDAESVGWWQRPFDPNFEAWMPVWLGHFLVLAIAAYRALQRRAPTDRASRLVPVAAYGLVTLNYFMAAPLWSSLGLAFLPVAIELICALEVLSSAPRRYGTLGAAVLVALVGVCSVLVAFGMERFAQPMKPELANSTVLRRCLSATGCDFAGMPERLKHRIAAAPLDPRGPIGVYLTQIDPDFPPFPSRKDADISKRSIEEAVDMLRRWAPHQPRVALLADSAPYILNNIVSVTALMQTGQWFRWPVSSPLNDEISEPLVAMILRRVAEDPMKDGEIIIVSNDRANLLPIEQKILAVVSARCRLALVETREFHSVFRVEACRPESAPER